MDWNSTNEYLVKEHVGFFKASSNYDIFSLEDGQPLMECREPNIGPFSKIFRFTKYKRATPFKVEVRDNSGNLIVEVTRGISLFLSNVRVYDAQGELLGSFKQKLFSLGGAFKVLDENETPVCELKGKWTGFEFKFLANDVELAMVTKKWSGLGKELFTSADNYVLAIDESVPPDSKIRKLILAAVMCIDLVLKE